MGKTAGITRTIPNEPITFAPPNVNPFAAPSVGALRSNGDNAHAMVAQRERSPSPEPMFQRPEPPARLEPNRAEPSSSIMNFMKKKKDSSAPQRMKTRVGEGEMIDIDLAAKRLERLEARDKEVREQIGQIRDGAQIGSCGDLWLRGGPRTTCANRVCKEIL